MPAYADLLASADHNEVSSSQHGETTSSVHLNHKHLPGQCCHMEEDVVVSGISGRFPESDSLDEFAQNLYGGVDMVTEDDRRWTPGLYGLPTRSGKIPSLHKFDASFFNVSPRQAHCMDPQLRILLEVTYEAICDAGVNPTELRGRRIGVYVGVSSSESEEFLARNPENISGYELTGCCRAMFANRISYALDLKGPSFAVDTACSSSLVALHNAWLAISRGEIEAAVVAGSNLTLKPHSSLQFHSLSMLSMDGKCKAFDAKGNGYVRSEAICAVFLQRSRDSRRIYAHVVQALTNTDGHKSEGVTFPSGDVQRQLLEEVYERSGVDPSFVSYVEAHGTGTKAGDPQELNALAQVFCSPKNPARSQPLLLGSVKSNMGHSEPTSGLCSLVKVCLAIQKQEIAGNLHYESPNRDIPALVEGKIQVVAQNTPWTGKYAALNCFGFGGANVHVLLKCPESRVQPICPERVLSPMKKKTKAEQADPNSSNYDIPRLVFAEGRSEEGVRYPLEAFINNKNEDFASLLDQLRENGGTAAQPFRGFAVVGAKDERKILHVREEGTEEEETSPQTWLIFSGMGSQWTGCGQRLMQLPAFANAIRKCQRTLLPLGMDVVDVITRTDPDPLLDTAASFVAIAAVQVGLVSVLRSVGIENWDGLIGHSVGELGCGFADGALNEEQTVLAAYWRGKAVQEAQLDEGAMVAVGLSADEVGVYLEGTEVTVACHNSDKSITISGPKKQVEMLHEKLTAEGIFSRAVNSGGIAFHHSSMAKAAPRLRTELLKVIQNPVNRSARWVSSSVPDGNPNVSLGRQASAEYLVNNLLSPVCFAQALKKIPSGATLIEVSPHALMQAVLRRALPESPLVPLVRKESKDPLGHLIEGLGKLYNLGMKIDVSSIYLNRTLPVPGNTPSMASLIHWNHTVDWDVASFKDTTSNSEFKVEVDLNNPEFSAISGHCIDGRVLFPATGYLVLVWRALAKMTASQWQILPVTLEDITLHQATVLSTSNTTLFTVRILLSKGDFEVLSGESVAASGKIRLGVKETPESTYLKTLEQGETPKKLKKSPKTTKPTQISQLNQQDIYKELRLRGYHYGGIFKGIQNSDLNGTKGTLSWANDWISFLDTMLQFSLLGSPTRALYLPTRIRKIQIDTEMFNQSLVAHEDQKDQSVNNVIPVRHNSTLGVTACPGLEIYGLKATLAPRRVPNDDPLLESYSFYQTVVERNTEISDRLTYENSVRLLLDLFLENTSSFNIKILHLPSNVHPKHPSADSPNISFTLLTKSILNIMEKYPLINTDYSIHFSGDGTDVSSLDEVESLGVKRLEEVDVEMMKKLQMVVVGEGRSEDVVGEMEKAFLLVEGDKMKDQLVKEHRFIVAGSIEKLGLHLLKKPRDEILHQQLVIQANDLSFKWVDELKLKLQDEASEIPLWVISEGNQHSGVIGMLKCLRNEPGGLRLRGLFDASGNVRTNEQTWNRILSQDLVFNIFKDGVQGTFRHLELKTQHREQCENAYLNVLTRGDLSSLTWLKAAEELEPVTTRNETKGNETKGNETKGDETRGNETRGNETTRNGAKGNKSKGKMTTAKISAGNKTTGKINTGNSVGEVTAAPVTLNGIEPASFSNELNSTLCRVFYAPLNFRDIMLASGKLPPDALPGNLASKDCILGLEFAGLDSRGSRVMGLVAAGGLATHVQCDPLLTWDVPSHWSLEQAATVPVVYATAYYALVVRGGIKSGESVLIHSGSGGVGQAAISIALSRGATVFTTVSSQKKRAFLMERFPQLTERNFCASRDATFAYHVLNETQGRGVDLVLNSLAGELLQASVRCLKEHGRFLEIGKADLANNTGLGMSIFLKNITFHGILLDALFSGPIAERLALQDIVYKGIASGEVRTLPATTFDHNQAEEAFRFMASGKHIGKVVLKIKDEEHLSGMKKFTVNEEKSIEAIYKLWPNRNLVYVITGGLGGLGLELCDWLIQRGATKLVLTSRRGVSTGYQSLCVNRWLSAGASVRVLTHDASTTEGAKLLLQESMKEGHIGGIFHLAVVLQDSLFSNQSPETFIKVCRTKADGAIALDVASRELCPYLHLWVTFSSVAAGRGNAGQSNYAWANSVSERVAEQRVRDGYPGIAIQWGGIADVGVLADTLGNVEVGGTKPQSLKSVLSTLDQLVGSGSPVTSSLCLVSKKSKGRDGTGGGKSILSSVANILGIRDIKTAPMNLSLGDLGMDSLMAVEIKQTLEREADVVLTAEQIRELNLQKIQEFEGGNSKNIKNDKKSNDKQETSEVINLHWMTNPLVPKSTIEVLSTSTTSNASTLIALSPIQGVCKPLRAMTSNLDVNVYGLQYTPEQPNGNIVELASYLLQEIDHLCQNGPIQICGYSFGACVAYEMSKQLEQKGKTPSKLVLLDGSHSYVSSVIELYRNKFTAAVTSEDKSLTQQTTDTSHKETEANHRYTEAEQAVIGIQGQIETLVAFALQLCPVNVDILREGLSKADSWEKKLSCLSGTVVEKVKSYGKEEKEVNREEIEQAGELFYQRLVAGFEHNTSPEKISVPTLLVRATQNQHSETFGKDYGLQNVLNGSLTVREVDGTHETFMEGKGASEVAQIVTSFLNNNSIS